MLNSVDKRNDGSVALFINGDLQFDSSDERIYHEALALPALAIAATRKPGGLSALVIGGGDGLIARELLKWPAVEQVGLVDYDKEIVELARQDFQNFNDRSMHDPRMNVHIMDAWEFVGNAMAAGSRFDVVVSDLTVADDTSGARFHSIEWYHMLRHLLTPDGILSVNAVSPQATPEAFWSIFNSMLSSGLHARPYHASIPSFQAQGFGLDWGFLLAGTVPIQAGELDQAVLAEPRMTLVDIPHVRSLFHLPEELFRYQSEAAPAHAGSEILLHYFRNSSPLAQQAGANLDSFALDTAALILPPADSGKNIFPPELRVALAECIHASATRDQSVDEAPLLDKVLELMPALQQFHTPELIADFVQSPAAFLESIDVAGLVDRLLQRAAELPAQLVEELRHLSDKMSEWAGDYFSLVDLGERVVTILTLVVVVGNLMYPDAVYGKGEHGGHHGGEHHGAYRGDHGRAGLRADRGFDGARRNAYDNFGRGWGGYRGYWGHNWGTLGWARPYHGFYWGGYVPPAYYGANNWPSLNVSNNEYVDETGTSYPARTYNYTKIQPATSGDSSLGITGAAPAAFRLADGADLMAGGNLAVPLTDQAFLTPTAQGTQLVDQSTGQPIIDLYNDPALLYQSAVEMKRQRHRLLRAIARANNNDSSAGPTAPADKLAFMQQKADLLETALNKLGPIPSNPPSVDETHPLIEGGSELFASVWMTPDGKFLAIKKASGHIAYMDGSGWYSDLGKTKLQKPYPTKLKAVATAYLSKMVGDADATRNMMLNNQKEGQAHLDMLDRELADYQSDPNGQPTDMVDFGSRKLPRSEAMRLTKLAAARTQNKLDELQKQIASMPAETQLAKQEIASLGGST